jgi:hypothetical protein
VRAQMAVAIEILLMAPIRMRNLVNLDIERNLVRSVQGGALHIVIGAEEVKTRKLSRGRGPHAREPMVCTTLRWREPDSNC